MSLFYFADGHFGHECIIRSDKRPWHDVDSMDLAMIHKWNEKVSRCDTVIVDGDFIYKSRHSYEWYLKQLNGHLILVVGNHDTELLNDLDAIKYFDDIVGMCNVFDRVDYNVNQFVNVHVCHYPAPESTLIDNHDIVVYAHTHKVLTESSIRMLRYNNTLNAGCMINNYEPVTLKEMIVNNLKWREVAEVEAGFNKDDIVNNNIFVYGANKQKKLY